MSDLHQLAKAPVKFDTALADLHEQAAKAEALLERAHSRIHALAGDKREWVGKRHLWKRTLPEVTETVQIQESQGSGLMQRDATSALADERLARQEVARVFAQIHAMDQVYLQYLWTRFFPCTNRDGHIHSSLRGCNSVYRTTPMAWRPDLSGTTVALAVEALGEALCTFCYPDAPSDWKAKTLGQVRDERTRAQREADKAAKEEKRYAKALRPRTDDDEGECFEIRERFGRGSSTERITTVAACKEVLRKEVEFRDFYGGGEHSSHAAYAEGARQAAAVLLKREAAKPGTGATQEQIDTIIANAVKRCIKSGARLNPDGSVK